MAAQDSPPEAAEAPRHPDRPDVFVSYAREDEQFVSTRLVVSLEARGKDVWIDRKDIPPASDWRERIGHGIDATRAFVFVLSPDSLTSDQCRQELRQAIAANKRLIPVVYREVDPNEVPDELNRPNWIWLRDDNDYTAQFERLVTALETDLEWVDSHARLGVRAGEWARADRDRGFLLRGNDLRVAERWLATEASHEEAATPEQRGYILTSRQAATRRQLLTVGAVALALVVSVGLGALAVVRAKQRQIAIQGRQAALAQRQLSDSRQVAAEAGVLHTSRPDLSMLLGVQAFRIAPTEDARGSLLTEQAQRYAGSLPPDSGLFTMAFSPDSRILATAGAGRRVKLWDVGSHRRLASFASPGSIYSLAFSPDGKVLAGAGDKVIYWDAHNAHRQLAVCEPSGTSARGIAFSPDGKTIAIAGSNGTVHLVAVPTCKEIKRFKLFAESASEVTFHPVDPTVVAAVGDHQKVKLLNVRTGARLASFPGNTSPVYSSALAFAMDGRSLATGGPDHTVTIWSTRTHALLSTLRGAPNAVGGIAFSPDGHTVVTASGSATTLWDVRTGQPMAALPRLVSDVSDVAFSPDGNLLATSGSDGTILLWKARGRVFQDAFGILRSVYSHDGKTLAVANANSVTLLDARTHNRKITLAAANRTEFGRGIWDIAFSPDDRLLATVGRNSAKLWDIRTGALLHEVTNRNVDFLMSVAFSNDGRTLAYAGLPGPIVLLDIATRRIKARWGVSGDFKGYRRLMFTGDGRYLVAVGPPVQVWDLRTRKHVATLGASKLGGASVDNATVSRDGQTLASSLSDGSIVQWDLSTRRRLPRQLSSFGGHTGAINDLAFSFDGRTLATAGEDETIKLWDVRTTRRLTATLTGHRAPVNSVSFTRDGTLASGSDDGTAIFWDLDPERVSREICRTLRTTLGRIDWARYVPNLSYRRVCPAYATVPSRLQTGARPNDVADLVMRLPGEAYRIAAMDMKRARRELGVAPDLDPKDHRGRQSTGTPEAAFDAAALKVVGYVTVGRSAAAAAIDHGLVSAGVNGTSLGADVVALATDQPMAQIVRGLQRRGFRQMRPGLYMPRSAKQHQSLSAVAIAPGLVILADSADEASAALARTSPDAPTAMKLKRLDTVRGSLRALQSYGDLPDKGAPCVQTVVGGHDFAGSADTLTLYLTTPARAGRVLLGSAAQRTDILTRDYQPKDISVSGSKIRMRIVTPPGAIERHNAATIAEGDVRPESLYRCGRAASRNRGNSNPP
jgi:WD40 repeat protein